MDDPFGENVWDTSSPSTSKATLQFTPPPLKLDLPYQKPTTNFQFDDFDDDEPQDFANDGREDDFGDFGDFDDPGIELGSASAYQDSFSIPSRASAQDWTPLSLDPLPPLHELDDLLNDLLHPIWDEYNLEDRMVGLPMRQAEGLNRILITSESRNLYNNLFNTSLPSLSAPNWTRSRIRRQHLISLGIPINLDEVMPHVNGKVLPTLEVTTRPASAPPVQRIAAREKVATNHSRAGSRRGSPRSSTVGGRRELDKAEVDNVLRVLPESLSLLPLATLEKQLEKLKEVTQETSGVLTHLLQRRDTLEQDSETYNGLIRELVGEAHKKTRKTKAK